MTAWMRAAAVLMSLALALPGAAQTGPIDVRIDVSGVRSDRGRILVALHEDRWDFPSRWDRALASASAPAVSGSVGLTLRVPRAGRFALIVVHDEDGDGRMKKSAVGLPREGYATGRNAAALEFPFFEAAQRDWTAGSRVAVTLVYP
jgi:uncharacterized protein (DUF2141 family)